LQKLIESKEDPPANSGSYSLDEHFNVDLKTSSPSKSSILQTPQREEDPREFFDHFSQSSQYNCLGGTLETIDEKSKSELETLSQDSVALSN
jgi:hypothetical protein